MLGVERGQDCILEIYKRDINYNTEVIQNGEYLKDLVIYVVVWVCNFSDVQIKLTGDGDLIMQGKLIEFLGLGQMEGIFVCLGYISLKEVKNKKQWLQFCFECILYKVFCLIKFE